MTMADATPVRDAPVAVWVRIALVVALALVHIGIWRPVRTFLVEHAAYPLVASLATPRAEGVALRLEPRTIRADADGQVYRYYAPAALGYLVIGLILIAAFPRRRYWLWLWLAHVALGVLTFAAFVLGVGWTPAGFATAKLGQEYLAPALSLLALIAPLIAGRAAGLVRGVDIAEP